MEMDEMIKILIAVFVLIIMVGVVIFLFSGKSVEMLDAVRNFLRFGGK